MTSLASVGACPTVQVDGWTAEGVQWDLNWIARPAANHAAVLGLTPLFQKSTTCGGFAHSVSSGGTDGARGNLRFRWHWSFDLPDHVQSTGPRPVDSRGHLFQVVGSIQPCLRCRAKRKQLQTFQRPLVLWCFVLHPHRRSPYSKFPFCITR